jgi:hypothetical protein
MKIEKLILAVHTKLAILKKSNLTATLLELSGTKLAVACNNSENLRATVHYEFDEVSM